MQDTILDEFAQSRRDNLADRPADSVVQSRCDCRTVATIARYFQARGLIPKSQAELVRLALEELRIVLTHNNLAKDVIATHDAAELLRGLGIGGFHPGGRSIRKFQAALLRDEVTIPDTIRSEGVAAAMKKLLADGTIKAIREKAEKED